MKKRRKMRSSEICSPNVTLSWSYYLRDTIHPLTRKKAKKVDRSQA